MRSFVLPPETDKGQTLRLTIYDRDSKTQDLEKHEVIGICICTVEDILKEGSSGKKLELENDNLKESGTVTIIGETFDASHEDHEIFWGRCKFRNTSLLGMFLTRPYLAIYRMRQNNEWTPIYRSNIGKKGEETSFSEDLLHKTKLRASHRGGSCMEIPLRIELRSHRSITEHKLIGAVQMSLGSLRRQSLRKKISLGLAGESVGELCVARSTLADNSSSFDLEISFRSK